jgi:hypothetical protein
MAQYAHAEIRISSDETDVELGFYNYAGADGFDPGESWEDLLSNLGRLGFEMVTAVPDDDATTYWFKATVA